jgi:diguanylate cyclase (GGDEF)-like protein/PAS domain S-box-containing protein
MTRSPFKRFQRQVLWLLLAFFVALTYFTARNLTENYVERQSAREVHAWTRVSLHINDLVHELQKERGLSSGLLSSQGKYFDIALTQQYAETDAALARLQALLASEERTVPLAQAIAGIDAEFAHLGELRKSTTGLKLSREYVTDQYSRLIEQLFTPQIAAISVGHVGWIYRKQMAYIFFLQAKEMAGQMRALLTAMLSRGDYSTMQLVAFTRIQAIEEARIEKFVQLADAESLDGHRAIENQVFVAEAKKILDRIAAVAASGRPPTRPMPAAALWYTLASKKIDAMSDHEQVLGERLLKNALGLEQQAHRSLWINALVVLASIALASSMAVQIWRGKEYAVKNLNLGQTVFDHSSEAIFVTDAQGNIVATNPAFTRITGYAQDEAIGRNPRLLQSGRHDDQFYAAIWRHIAETGRWEGEIWNRRKNGEIYPGLLSIAAVKDDHDALTNYIAMTIDLAKYKETEALLEHLRTFDPLTGLPNREAWRSALDQAIVNARRAGNSFAVLDIGLDRFKLVNESFGHPVGDQVLAMAAERIRQTLRRHDIAARAGGDRFSVLLADLNDAQTASAFCERLNAAFVPPFEVQGQVLPVSVSIGIALYPNDGKDTHDLLSNAESALYRAKEEGCGSYTFYAREMNAAGAQMLMLERMLRLALDNREFSIVYQPQVAAGTRRLVGVEALLRWHNPTLGQVSPVQFIPIAETTGLIVPIGEWVLRESCRQAGLWRQRYGADIAMGINLSTRQFRREDLMATVQLALEANDLPARLVELEITEGLLMNDPASAALIMDGLRWMGVKIAIDDFGTGYSSLAYLKNFPLDRIKLDRAFVKDLPENESEKAIARTVIALGRNLGLQTLAEGVETAAQAEFLAAAGCEVFQGYLFGKPMKPAELEAMIDAGELTLT